MHLEFELAKGRRFAKFADCGERALEQPRRLDMGPATRVVAPRRQPIRSRFGGRHRFGMMSRQQLRLGLHDVVEMLL